jgi:anaerobic sulfite reductase subunit B
MSDAGMVPARYRVVDRRPELADTVTLTLEPVDAPLERARPGQFNMLWAFGIGEVPISVAGHDRMGRVEHTIRAVGSVTTALCASQAGTMVGARGPFGRGFDLGPGGGGDGGHMVVIAGGVGLAPLRSVIGALRRGPHPFRRVTVLVGARSPHDVLYPSEHDDWRRDDIELLVTVDTAGPGWVGHVGVVTKHIDAVVDDPTRTVAVVCGPEVMMRFAVHELLGRGVVPEAVQVSLERNMHCAVGLCGRCQLGQHFVCHDGPVFAWGDVVRELAVRER